MQAPKKRGRKKLTPWFDGSVTPARPGVYQRIASGGPLYAMWSGDGWKIASLDRREAQERTRFSAVQGLPWRGLAEKP